MGDNKPMIMIMVYHIMLFLGKSVLHIIAMSVDGFINSLKDVCFSSRDHTRCPSDVVGISVIDVILTTRGDKTILSLNTVDMVVL